MKMIILMVIFYNLTVYIFLLINAALLKIRDLFQKW